MATPKNNRVRFHSRAVRNRTLPRCAPIRWAARVLSLSLSSLWFRRPGLLKFLEPGRDSARGNQLSWRVRIDRAGIDRQPFIELRSREVLGFGFTIECSGHPRASSLGQQPSFAHLEGNVPGMRHGSPASRRTFTLASANSNLETAREPERFWKGPRGAGGRTLAAQPAGLQVLKGAHGFTTRRPRATDPDV